jgi:hypothetical protein
VDGDVARDDVGFVAEVLLVKAKVKKSVVLAQEM